MNASATWPALATALLVAPLSSAIPAQQQEEEEEGLRVRVVDFAGEPVPSARVAVLHCGPWNVHGIPSISAVCDEHGRARLATDPLNDVQRAYEQFFVGVMMVSASPRRVPLTEALTKDEIQLVISPYGSVVVEVETPHPAMLQGARAQLVVLIPDREDVESPVREPPRSEEIELVDGRASFPFVAPGLDLRVELCGPELPQTTTLDFLGPPRAGETTTLQLVTRPCLVVRGRLRGADGNPIASTVVHLRHRERKAFTTSLRHRELFTDADGRYRLFLAADGSEHRLSFALSRLRGPTFGVHDLGSITTPGERELEDRQIGRGPLIAAGKVVDAQGRGIPGAEVRLVSTTWSRRPVGAAVRPASWRVADDGPTITGEDGSFRIPGTPNTDDPHHGIAVSKSGWIQSDVHRLGDLRDRGARPTLRETALRIHLQKPGTLTVPHPVLRSPDGGRIPLQWRLHRTDPSTDTKLEQLVRHARLKPALDAQIFRELAPGTYRLCLLRNELELFEIDRIVVHEGEAVQEPRLQGLDLDALASVFRLTVPAVGDAHIPRGSVRVVLTCDGTSTGVPPSRDGPYWCVSPRGASTALNVSARGFRPQFFHAHEDTEVRLRPRLRVRARPHPDPGDLLAGVWLHAVVIQPGRRILEAHDILSNDPEVQRRPVQGLDGPGPHEIRWCVSAVVEENLAGTVVQRVPLAHPPTTVDIEDRDEIVELELSVTQELLDQAMDAARRLDARR